MSIKARREYLAAIRERYQKSCKKGKTAILDEFCKICGYSRSYAIRILNSQAQPRVRKPGRKPIYNESVLVHLKALWEATGRVCSKKLKAAIPIWLKFYKPEEAISPQSRELLLRISPATIDRILYPHRKLTQKGKSTTSGSIWIKNNIPLKTLDQKIKTPGHIEADTVSHCGDNASGAFVSTLTMTDVFSAWTENRATWTKKGDGVLETIKEIDRGLPFNMCAYTADNGNEVLNKDIKDYFQNRPEGRITPKRGRPYKKNDNCYVEQKNWTHVRSLFGYHRLDDKIFVPLMNEVYRAYWNPLQNFFMPMAKLKEKKRIGSKIVKTYKEYKTPFQRLIESDQLSTRERRKLIDRKNGLNPFTLRREMEKKLEQIMKLADIRNKDRDIIERTGT